MFFIKIIFEIPEPISFLQILQNWFLMFPKKKLSTENILFYLFTFNDGVIYYLYFFNHFHYLIHIKGLENCG